MKYFVLHLNENSQKTNFLDVATGAYTDVGFILEQNKIENRKKDPVSRNGGLHQQAKANPANQLISEKLANFNPCIKVEFFEDQMTSYEVVHYKVSLASSKWLARWIKVDRWDCFYFRSQDFFIFIFYFHFLFSEI